MKPNVDSMPLPYLTPPTTSTTLTSLYYPGPAAHEDLTSEHLQETPKSPVGPVSIVEAAVRLDSIFLIEGLTKETLEGYNLDGRNVLRPTDEIPELTDEQVGQAMAVIPADYWQLSCWSCRSSGHSTFTCPKLSVKQRIYFAYCYYLHQVLANPILKHWFWQKGNALQGKRPGPGPRPSQGSEYNCAQSSAHPNAQRRGPQRQIHLIDQLQVIEEPPRPQNGEAGPPPHPFIVPGDTGEENEFEQM